ncbi:MAG: putative toxin-antitoxin system toxin component, PIN family [Anaerolineales bacterium]|nr:putative toxin-antitoxin system toxin component, PIN family [Anaerolineales bacterium]
MRVVLDANIFVRALLTKRGNPKQILDAWEQGAFELFVSQEILVEINRVLRYPHIARIHMRTDEEIARFIQHVEAVATIVTPTGKIEVVGDESDNRYLECAVEAGATYVVTGDKKHLLPIEEYRGIHLVPPAVFIALLNS